MNRLTSAEKKHLRGIAQRLKPVVLVGRQGVTPMVMQEVETALERDELIKVRFDATRDLMKAQVAQIAVHSSSDLVGTIGRTATFYRQHEQPGAGS